MSIPSAVHFNATAWQRILVSQKRPFQGHYHAKHIFMYTNSALKTPIYLSMKFTVCFRPAHLCAVKYMTEMSVTVTINKTKIEKKQIKPPPNTLWLNYKRGLLLNKICSLTDINIWLLICSSAHLGLIYIVNEKSTSTSYFLTMTVWCWVTSQLKIK